MSLEQTELRQEQLLQLRQLAQSPGWALLRQRLSQLEQRSESEKASLLRDSYEGRETRASYLQGKVDGLQAAVTELSRYEKDLEQQTLPTAPAY